MTIVKAMIRRRKWIVAAVLLVGIVGAMAILSIPRVNEWRLRRNVISADSPDKKVHALVDLLRCYEANCHLHEITLENYDKKLGIDPAKTIRYEFGSLPPSFPTTSETDPLLHNFPSTCETVAFRAGDSVGMVELEFLKDRRWLVSWEQRPKIILRP